MPLLSKNTKNLGFFLYNLTTYFQSVLALKVHPLFSVYSIAKFIFNCAILRQNYVFITIVVCDKTAEGWLN